MSATTSDEPSSSPLSPAVFHILLALADGELHGYAIMREVERSTDAAVRMGPGTLYGALKKLLHDGWIEETAERPDPRLDDKRRRYYTLTGMGAQILNNELDRFRTLLRAARGRKWVRAGGMAA